MRRVNKKTDETRRRGRGQRRRPRSIVRPPQQRGKCVCFFPSLASPPPRLLAILAAALVLRGFSDLALDLRRGVLLGLSLATHACCLKTFTVESAPRKNAAELRCLLGVALLGAHTKRCAFIAKKTGSFCFFSQQHSAVKSLRTSSAH